jgi:signal transduction histidine kinase
MTNYGTAVVKAQTQEVQHQRVKILLVDDKPENLIALEAVLETLGQDLVKAESAREALRHLLEHDFAAILLDVKMPDMDGFECAAMIRERERSRDTPILFLTALKSEEHLFRGYFMGAVDYLSKPIVPEILRSKVAVFVELARKNMMLQQKNAELEASVRELQLAEERILKMNLELEQRVAERTQELSRTNEELRQFAYIASHDLQEPLRTVGSYAQLLAKRYRGRLDSSADDFVNYMVDGVQRMHALLNDMLAYSRVSDKETQTAQLTDLNEVLNSALLNMETTIQESEASISFDPLPTLVGDELQLVQVFQNLIGNAIKYRSTQTPQIHVSTYHENHCWVISVRDNGIGIEPKYNERIFGIFKRLHGKELPGTGMGLAICKKVIERHGGRIWLESQLGAGSTFYFALPG